MIPETVSHYRILKRLGGGGMGEVYSAQDFRLGRAVALKFLPEVISRDPTARERFYREARAASSLNHPHICTIFDVDEADGRPFLAMELLQGQTLKERISGRPIATGRILDLGVQVADALSAAHARGVIHRDIKPANIFVTDDGQVKVLDFGLAKVTGRTAPGAGVEEDSPTPSRAETQLTSPGTALGTVAYMSPEQARGEGVDERSDIFSFGSVLYEMATGALPFSGPTHAVVFDGILNRAPAPPSHLNPRVPPQLDEVILRALEKDPARRYQSAGELLADLRNLREGELAARIPKSGRRRYAVLLALLAACLLGAALWNLIPRWMGTSVPERQNIAILQFANMSSEASRRLICDGLVENLTSRLTQVEQFRQSLAVFPASEVRDRQITSPSEARRALGVNLVVTGALQSEGDALRLIVNLVDASTTLQIDSRRIGGLMTGISALEDEAAIQLAEMLHLELEPAMLQTMAVGETTDPAAALLYLEGRGSLRRYDRIENIDGAIVRFEEAVRKDPAYALAHAALGEAYWRKYEATKDESWVEPAVRNCRRALELAEKLAPAHVTLGVVLAGTGSYEGAVEEFKKGIAADARNADAFRGLALAYEKLGRLEEAESTYSRAIQLRPDQWPGYNELGAFYWERGRYQDAVLQWKRVAAIVPDNSWAYNNMGAAYLRMGLRSEALAMFETAVQITPDPGALSNLGSMHFADGRYEEAARLYEQALQQGAQSYAMWGNLGEAYRRLGRAGKAHEAFGRAAELAEATLRVNPLDSRTMVSLATYQLGLERHSEAADSIKKAMAIGPPTAELLFEASQVYEALGRREEALKSLGEAMALGFSAKAIQQSLALRDLRNDPRYTELIRDHDRK